MRYLDKINLRIFCFRTWGGVRMYVFDKFELDPGCAELRCSGEVVPVEPQVFQLLELLVSSRDRVVTRDEIFERIWGNRIVSDAALSSRIRDARKAIGDDGSSQRLIRTVQRRGLRFVGNAEEVEQRPVSPVRSEIPAAPLNRPVVTTADTDGVLERSAVAVFPFADHSGDETPAYLADSLTDEVAAALGAWRFFPVISQNTVSRFVDSTLTSPEIGAAIGARYLLTGSFRRVGNRIKVSVTLTDAVSDCQIWNERISRDIGDLIDVEEEIAAQVATLIVPELEGAEARRVLRKSADDLTAWDLAMRAGWLIKQGSAANFAEAEKLAARAAERAPDWPLPYTLVAVARFQQAMTCFSSADSRTAFADTLAAAKTALEIDQGAWIAHALSAVGELWTNLNHDRAIRHVNRAIELNPSAAMNYHFGGCIHGFAGDPAGARKHQERLFRLDPVYPYTAVIEADLGLWHMLDSQFPEADQRLQRAQHWDPRYGRALQRRIALSGLMDDRETALDAARKLSELGLPLDYETIAASYPFRNPDHGEMFLDGLRRSGVNF
jgi:adenylate cyclase